MTSKQLFEEALSLPRNQRVDLLESLEISLHGDYERIQQLRIQHALDRLKAFGAGNQEAVSEEEVFAEFDDL